MYHQLVESLMRLSLIKGLMVAGGWFLTIYMCYGFIRAYMVCNEYETRASKIKFIVLMTTSFLSIFAVFADIAVYSSKYVDTEWLIAREVAKQVDVYAEKNPDSIFSPEELLKQTDSAVVSIFNSIQEVPNIVKKLSSGVSMNEIQQEREWKEFQTWKESQRK